VKTTAGYSGIQIALHWLVAILILVAWLHGEGAEEAMEAVEDGGTAGFVPHVAIGLAILALVVDPGSGAVGRGAPLPGVPGSLAVKASGLGPSADLPSDDRRAAGRGRVFFLGLEVGDVHGLAANVLMLVVLGHALMALYHQYVLKDGLLRRMMRAG
jgi:cytochrome b561